MMRILRIFASWVIKLAIPACPVSSVNSVFFVANFF